ncbi:MAG: Flp pilus assembly protein CpaB [Alphaproteobacteria bacterium]
MEPKRIALAAIMVIAAFLVFTQVRKMATPVTIEVPAQTDVVAEQIEYTDVLVATSEVPFGTRLTEAHMKWTQWPAEVVGKDFLTNSVRPQAITELVGSVARSVIYENEPISERKLVKPGTQGLMATLLKPGMRAVTIRISVDTAAGGFIQPGDRVDVMLTTSQAPNPTFQAVESRTQIFSANTIFENVRVLAIDQTFSTNSESGASVIGSTATFEMSQQDAEVLQEAVAQGDITLTLRPMGPIGDARGKSHARIKKKASGEVSSLTVYRGGQPTQVAIKGQ